MHDSTVDHKKEVWGKGATLPDTCGSLVGSAVDTCSLYLEEWIVVDLCNDLNALWLKSISLKGGEQSLWMYLIKGFLPVQQKHVQG